MKFPRFYQDFDQYLEPNKVLVVYGPRQVGKTTLLEENLAQTSFKYKLDSGDNITTQQVLGSQDFSKILEYVSGYELIAIDEAQRIPSVGMGLKIIVDQVPGIRVVVTGSATFELSGQIGEPLTGRKRTLTLYPMAQLELSQVFSRYELKGRLSEWLVFGGYPAVVAAPAKREKRELLDEIMNSYLLKEILTLERVKGSKVLLDLLRLLAYQLGSEVSLSELGTQLGIDSKTVARYLDLLEKSFVLFHLRGFSRNMRKEITKKSKYYFYDNGIRNALIQNYNDLEVRNDVGQLFENFLVIERVKKQEYHRLSANNYFWRTWDQKEVDWVEEREGRLFGYEFRFSSKKKRVVRAWQETYPDATHQIVSNEDYLEFVT